MKTTDPGCLFIVSTPIGNLGDMSQRAIEVLSQVDLIASEDTRHSGRLLKHFNITTPQTSLHDHNEQDRINDIITRVQAGTDVALISDAGTPLISDPGFKLVRAAHAHGVAVSPVPGACALIAALSVAGLPTDRFAFEGFLVAREKARVEQLEKLSGESRTMIFYLSKHKVDQALTDCIDAFGGERTACLVRELTKLHETIIYATLADILQHWQEHVGQHKGELVLLIQGVSEQPADDEETMRILRLLLEEMGASKAAAVAAKITGCRKNHAYQLALTLAE